jgi:hypothetical protein
VRRIVIIAAIGALTLAACSSGSSKNTSANNNGNSTATTTAGGGSSGSDQFSQLVSQSSKANIKVTYQTSDGKTLTIAQDGNGKSAVGTGDGTFYTDGQNTVSCNGTGSSAKCTQIPAIAGQASQGLTALFTGLYAGLTKLSGSAYNGHVSDDTIAGRSAKCVTFKASDFAGFAAVAGSKDYDPNASATVCVDKDTGILLKLVTTGKNAKDLFVAQNVGMPSSSDFAPPVTPETIPNISIPNISIPNITVP